VSTGWPRVKATCGNIGWRFDPWQDAVGRLILAKREGGKWAADLSILSIPRQVGKSYLLGCIIFALCLLNPKLRVIWTSHHTATTEEMYEAMKELAQHKRVAPHVVKCIALQGSRWRIVFRNGSRIDFGARSQGFGRGKAKVGVLVLDEFQHITTRALANLAPTTNTSDNPLILCAGTPPGPEVNGEAFTMRRRAVLEGLSDDTFYVEFSADRDADPDDRRQWSKANPSFPRRTQERAFLLLRKVLEPADFRREALGIWDADDIAAAIPFGVWSNLADRSPEPAPHVGKIVLGVDSTLERSRTSIVAAGGRADGPPLVELIENLPGVDWAFDRLVAMCGRMTSLRS
jgi:phage terminase large subunit-like protein